MPKVVCLVEHVIQVATDRNLVEIHEEMSYLKPSYFSGTLILAIFCRQGFSVFLF